MFNKNEPQTPSPRFKICVLCVLTLCASIFLSFCVKASITLKDEECVYSHDESGFSIVIPTDYYYLTSVGEWKGYDQFYSEDAIKEMADRNLRDKIGLEMYDEEWNTHYTVLFSDKGEPTDFSDKTVQDDLISSIRQRLPENLKLNNSEAKNINGITYLLSEYEDSDRGQWFSYTTFSGNYLISVNVNPPRNKPISLDEYEKAEDMLMTSAVRPYDSSKVSVEEENHLKSNGEKYLLISSVAVIVLAIVAVLIIVKKKR